MSHTAADDPQRHRYTVADYHRMGEAGILPPDARVELIDGDILDMPPIGFRHSGTVDKLTRILVTACGERAIVRVQGPIQLGDSSEPQPDVTLLRPRPDFFTTSAAAPSDVLLVIEVAATSQRYDRDVKRPLYARHGIPEVWLIDLEAGHLARHRHPQAGRYTLADQPARPRRQDPTVRALCGIPEVWLVELRTKRLVRHLNPQQGAYALIDQPDVGSPLDIAALPGTRVDLSTLFD